MNPVEDVQIIASPCMHGADGQGRPLGFVLTGGETSDYSAVPDLFTMPVNRPRRMLADKGYDADAIRQELLFHGTRPRSTRKDPPPCDYRVYKDRNRIERMFNRIKQFRRIATRCDKTRTSYAGFLALAAAKIWLPHFVSRA
ncbi:IS5 family transposase [Rhizobium mongolense]